MIRVMIETEEQMIEYERENISEACNTLKEIFEEEPELIQNAPWIYMNYFENK